MNTKITLLVPTFNRPNFLLRLLNFYRDYDFPFRIIVLDSSSEKITNDEFNTLLNSQYIDHQKFNPSIPFAEKIAKGVELVNTPYTVLCADDDVIFSDAIAECVNFLDNHNDYAIAYGHYIGHTVVRKKLRWGVQGKNASIQSDNAIKRIENIFTVNNPIVYAVTRTHIMKSMWEETARYTHGSFGLFEFLSASIGLLHGKAKELPVLYASREANYYTWHNHKQLLSMYSDDKIMLCVEGLVKSIVTLNLLSEQKAKAVVAEFMQQIVDNIKNRISKPITYRYRLIDRIFSTLGLKYLVIGILQAMGHPRYSMRKKIAKLPNFKHNFAQLKKHITQSYQEELVKSRQTYL